MFWGIILENGKRYSQVVDSPFHISMASLECTNDDADNTDPVAVMIEHQHAEFMLCTLKAEATPQQHLDLNFEEDEEITLFINGKGTVHLTGYLLGPYEDNEDLSDLESESESEQENASTTKKRKTLTNLQRPAKKLKSSSMFDKEGEEVSDELLTSDEEEEEELFVKKSPQKANASLQKGSKVCKTPQTNKFGQNKTPNKMNASENKGVQSAKRNSFVDVKKEPVIVFDSNEEEESDEESEVSDEMDELEEIPNLAERRPQANTPFQTANVSQSKKSKTSKALAQSKNKQQQLSSEEYEEDDDDDDDDEYEEELLIQSGKQQKKNGKPNAVNTSMQKGTNMPAKNKQDLASMKSPKNKQDSSSPKTPSTPGQPNNLSGNNSTSEKKKRKRKKKKKKPQQTENDAANESLNKSTNSLPNVPTQKKISELSTPKSSQKLPGGVLVEEMIVGSGPVAKKGKLVQLHYVGRLKSNNKVFDQSKNQPFRFRVGRNEVIPGMDQGIEGMKVGGKRRIVIPPHKGYGSSAEGPIPPNSTLVFDIELKSVN